LIEIDENNNLFDLKQLHDGTKKKVNPGKKKEMKGIVVFLEQKVAGGDTTEEKLKEFLR